MVIGYFLFLAAIVLRTVKVFYKLLANKNFGVSSKYSKNPFITAIIAKSTTITHRHPQSPCGMNISAMVDSPNAKNI